MRIVRQFLYGLGGCFALGETAYAMVTPPTFDALIGTMEWASLATAFVIAGFLVERKEKHGTR